ncbi:metal ABC transporter ATP-binding protein [Dactylosporangium sp. CS-047395]|uniref:metal ABC transporter ATP-binding protein n=1 Tax=Dactylosporangium sp. CS-047395 TaxID=3239936 RepID=UPI003D9217F1
MTSRTTSATNDVAHASAAALALRDASLRYGRRRLWSGLNLLVAPGEFLAVLGANGSGKTSFLRAVLGLQHLDTGTVLVAGRPPRQARDDIGYVPQQRHTDPLVPLRVRDVVGQGLDGHRWGIGWPSRARRRQIEAVLEAVGAAHYTDAPIGRLSGGEQQRVRIAQALVADPKLLLCDEPLLSLDLRSQRTVTALVNARRRTSNTAVVFVTHEINPVLPYVDRVLYLAGGQFRIGPVTEVLNSTTLSELYDMPVDVIHTGGRIVVAGLPHTAPEPDHALAGTGGAA